MAGLSHRISPEDLREAFEKFGAIRDIVIKGKYAFIDFEQARDAKAAIEGLDGQSVNRHDLVV